MHMHVESLHVDFSTLETRPEESSSGVVISRSSGSRAMSIDEGMKKARTACESAAASLKAATARATEATGEFTGELVTEEFSRTCYLQRYR